MSNHESDAVMEAAFATLLRDVRQAEVVEGMLSGSVVRAAAKRAAKPAKAGGRRAATAIGDNPLTAELGVCPYEATAATVRHVVRVMATTRKRRCTGVQQPTDDEELSAQARFTDRFALAEYQRFLHYVPRIVNVVRLRRPKAAMSTPGRKARWP